MHAECRGFEACHLHQIHGAALEVALPAGGQRGFESPPLQRKKIMYDTIASMDDVMDQVREIAETAGETRSWKEILSETEERETLTKPEQRKGKIDGIRNSICRVLFLRTQKYRGFGRRPRRMPMLSLRRKDGSNKRGRENR